MPKPSKEQRIQMSIRIRAPLFDRLRDHAFREGMVHSQVAAEVVEAWINTHIPDTAEVTK